MSSNTGFAVVDGALGYVCMGADGTWSSAGCGRISRGTAGCIRAGTGPFGFPWDAMFEAKALGHPNFKLGGLARRKRCWRGVEGRVYPKIQYVGYLGSEYGCGG